MIRERSFNGAGRRFAESPEHAGTRCTARSPRAKSAAIALGAALVAATTQFAVGCAEETERVPAPVTQQVEPDSAIRVIPQRSPSEDQPLDGMEYRLEKKRNWWNDAREVLFADIDLSAEQARAVDAIIDAQLNTRALLQQLDAKLKTARNTGNAKSIEAVRAEFRAVEEKLRKPHEIYEEMRAVLAEAQHSAFDLNRARLVAKAQSWKQTRPDERAGLVEPE